MTELEQKAVNWLNDFAKCVREVDYESGRKLCLENIVSYGTVAGAVRGLDNLVERQWMKIWPNTEGFHFLTEGIDVWGEGVLAIGVEWQSTGIGVNGTRFDRRGRSSIVLTEVEGSLFASHTHFSAIPQPSFPERF